MLVDSHCHLHFNAYKEDGDEVARRSLDSGVFLITVGTRMATSRAAVDFASRYKNGVWAAIGLHPGHLQSSPADSSEEDADSSKPEKFDADFYKKLARSSKKIVAIGECGLDYYRLPDGISADVVREKQKEIFGAHIRLATELNLPLTIHVRDGSGMSAHEDAIEILQGEISAGGLPRKGVMHCYSGTWEQAKKYFDLGFLISFTGIIMFPPKKGAADVLGNIVKNTPLDKFLIETDAPYLAPPPYRGKRNEPAYVRFVAEHIAKIKQIGFEEVAAATAENAKKLFGLSF